MAYEGYTVLKKQEVSINAIARNQKVDFCIFTKPLNVVKYLF